MQHSDDLDDVYGAKSPEESQAVYDRWAGDYDRDNLSKGFRLPALGAGLLARYLGEQDGPVLDAGCGTGLVGETLALLGYDRITGCDLSLEMMAIAERTGAYTEFQQVDFGQGLPFEDNHFAGFTCVGSFGPGHAPPETLNHLVRVTQSGGYGVFNLIERTWQSQGFPDVMEGLSHAGKWKVVKVTQPFLPFMLAESDLWSRAYVVRIL